MTTGRGSSPAAVGEKRSTSVLSRLPLLTVGLWGAIALQKLATFGLQLAFGRTGGLEAVGLYATIGAICSVVGAVLHFGLPDWVMYRVARQQAQPLDDEPAPGVGHGLFLVAAVAGYGLVALTLPAWVPTADVAFALVVVVGLLGHHLASFSFAGLRGAGRPAIEIVALSLSACVVAVGALPGMPAQAPLAGLLVAGLVQLAAVGWSVARHPFLRPLRVDVSALRRQVVRSLPYLAIGGGAMALGSADLFVARLFGSTDAVGELQCATAVLRAGTFAPWVAATLVLHRLVAARADGRPLPLGVLFALGSALALLAMAGAYLTGPQVAHGFGVAFAQVEASATLALWLAPLTYLWVMYLPVITVIDPRSAQLAVALGLLVALGVGAAASPEGVAGALVASAAGHAVAAGLAFRSLRKQPAPSLTASERSLGAPT